MPPKQLTDKQAAFVREYLVDFCASHAAVRAGYSAKSSRKTAHDLLLKPHVAALIDAAKAERAGRLDITVDRIVREYEKIAFSVIAEATETDLRTFSAKLRGKLDALEALGRHMGAFGDALKIQRAIEELLENVSRRVPAEVHEQIVTAVEAAMGLAPVAAGPAPASEGGAGGDSGLH